jgi:hypothetical protein
MKKLITLLFVLMCFSGFGQVYQLMPQYGYQANRFRFDSTLQIPTVCGVPTLKSNVTKLGAIAFDSCNNRFYTYNPKTATWSQVSGGGGSTDTTSLSARIDARVKYTDTASMLSPYFRKVDTATLSNRINLKVDSLKRRSDSVFAYRNGTQVFQFKDSVGTNPPPVGYYGSFIDTTTQTAAVINTAYPVKLGVTELSNGVSIVNNLSGNPTRITIANAGIYNIQFSLQLEKTGGSGNMTTDIWLRKNGVNIPNTTGKVVLTGSANASPTIAAWNYVIDASSNDYFELMWATSNVNVEIVKNAAIAPHPLVPSAILTVTQQSGIMAGTGISPLDTASMLAPYLRKTDTTSLSLRIDQRVRYSDTASMLSPYFRRSLSANDTIKTNGRVLEINAIRLTKSTSLKIDTLGITADVTSGANSSDLLMSTTALTISQINGVSTNVISMQPNTGVDISSANASTTDGFNTTAGVGAFWYVDGYDTIGILPRTNGAAGQVLKLQNGAQMVWANDESGSVDTTSLSNRINTKLNITDTSVFQRKQLPAYSFQANGTSAAANSVATYFKDTSGTYTGTIAWTGTTAPSGATNHSYRWTRIGKCVTLNVNLVYATNGGALTAVVFDLPSDAPTPAEPAGLTGASQNMYPVLVWNTNASNALVANSARGFLRNNSGNNAYEFVVNMTTSAVNAAYITLNYWTD